MYRPEVEPHALEPGDWTFLRNGEHGLWACLPNGDMCDLSKWNVIGPKESPSVTPSIQTLPTDAPNAWHGYLTNGEWKVA